METEVESIVDADAHEDVVTERQYIKSQKRGNVLTSLIIVYIHSIYRHEVIV